MERTQIKMEGRGTQMDVAMASMGLSMAQFQTNYTFGLMKMAMNDAEQQAAAMIDMISSVSAPAQYSFDTWA